MKSRKIPLWIPYPDSLMISKNKLKIIFNGGIIEEDFKDILTIMFYGSICELNESFLDKTLEHNIPIIFHKRNISKAIIITNSTGIYSEDIISKQIIYRNNHKKSYYIAKQILDAKFKSMKWLVEYPNGFRGKYLTIEEMRRIEAWHANNYWKKYYGKLHIDATRRDMQSNEVSKTLDAISKFIFGIILRWIHYHNLSPAHGFLHTQTNYEALVYDLIEPYRGYIDKLVFQSLDECIKNNVPQNKFLPYTIQNLKEFLDEKIYTNTTRQIVTFHELLHGGVLALRAYLNGEMEDLIFPIVNKPNGGRPIKVSYKLYGRSAGKTDFWQVARSL